MIVTSYYTSDEYRVYAEVLALSLDVLEIDHDIRALDDQGSPEANRAYKPFFLIDMMDAYPDEPILWLDADSTVRKRPTLFETLQGFDLACFYWTKGKPWNGTLYLAPTENARAAISVWAMLNAETPSDMVNFQEAMTKCYDFRIYPLPVSYCWVRRWMRDRYSGVDPIVEHEAVSVK